MRSRNVIFAALLAVFILAPGVSAQQGNQSDVSGVSNTQFIGGTPVFSGTSGTFSPAQLQNMLSVFNSIIQGLIASFSTAVAQVIGSVFMNSDPAALQSLINTFTGMIGGLGGSTPSGLGSGLSSPSPWAFAGMGVASTPSPVADEAAEELVAALAGLMATINEAEAGDIEIRATERLIHAVDEWNEFVNRLPEESLRNPPQEFLAVHAVLTGLVEAANDADDVGIENNDIGEVEGQVDE